MKKLILFVAGLMAIATTASAQGIVNSGVRMVCKSGTYWVVDGNFTLKSESAPSQATAANIKINTGANLTLTGASVLSVSGWWQNDGAFTAATGSTVTLNGTFKQELGGASETTFSNLTLNNTEGATFYKNITTNGILNFQNGIIYTGELSAIIGASGSITNASATKFINGRLEQTFSAVGSKIFPIGMAGYYRPLSFQYTSLAGTSTVTAEQVENYFPPNGADPANCTVLKNRYWILRQTGGSSFAYKVGLDGTDFNAVGTKLIIKSDLITKVANGATYADPIYTNTDAFTTMGYVTVGYTCTPQTVVFDALPKKTSCSEPFTVSATGGASGNPVVFTSSNTKVATCTGTNGSTITIIDAGLCDITATQAGNDAYYKGVKTQRLTVSPVAYTSIYNESIATQTKCLKGAFSPLTFSATGSGLTYQWYSNTIARNSGGTSLGSTGGANTISYTPQSAVAGTLYYYCVVTGTCGSATSAVSKAMITIEATTISSQSTDAQTQCQGGTYTPITVTATGSGLTYQWYKNSIASKTGGSLIAGTANGAQTNSYTPQSTVAGTLYYFCNVTSTCGNVVSAFSGAFVTNAATAISSQSTKTQTICQNGSFSPITVTATGGSLTYQWYSNTTSSNTGGTSLESANGAQTNSYTPQPSTVGSLYYYCVVTGSCGSATSAVSGAFVVTAATTISSQSTDAQTKCLNDAFSAITVTASGTGTLSYQWYSNPTSSTTGGTSLGTVSGANTNSYTPQSAVAGTLYYYCVVSSTCGSVTSAVSGAMITNAATAISSQSMLAQTKCINAAFSPITVTATGTSLTYQWYSNATASNSGGSSLGTNNGAGTNSYTPPSAEAGTLYYYCLVTGTCGTVTSAVSGAMITNAATAISSQSTATQTACINGSFNAITVTAAGVGLTYQWYSNGTASATDGTSLGTSNGANTNSYTPLATSVGTLYYYCVVTGTCGSVTSNVSGAFITNAATAITAQSTLAQTKCINVAFSPITVTATGAGLSYQWYSNATASVTGGTSLAAVDGAQTSSYTPSSATAGTTYYYCIVTGTCSTATSSVSGAFIVNPLPAAAGTITGTATVCQGQEAVAYSVASITNATGYTWAYSGTGATITGTTNSVTITFAADATAGNLTVNGTNGCGNGTVSATYGITVNAATVISGQSTNTQSQCTGGAFTAINVTAAGSGSLTYQWYSNTTANNSGGTSLGSVNGAQTGSYTPQTSVAGTLYYYCVVTGSCGPATSAISGAFIVSSSTVISSQSTASQTQCLNGSFNPITVTATGAGLSYQWYRNALSSNSGGTSLGVDNGAQTSSYTPQATTASTIYYYYCIVHGNCGSDITSAVSDAFIVSALPEVPTSLTATPASVCSGYSSLLNATSAGNNIDWYTASSGGTYMGSSASGADYTIYPGSTATYYAEAIGSGANNSGRQTFGYSGSIVNFTVPDGVTSLVITAKGAQGGSNGGTGGLGASMTGSFSVTPGQVLSILVGQHPVGNGLNAGGGGGTFVALGASYTTATPLIVAGGGGGSSSGTGGAASLTTTGNGSVPGTAGNGAPGSPCGGGGGGFLTSGVWDERYHAPGGAGFKQGGAGGTWTAGGKMFQSGGFGGGAAANGYNSCQTLGGAGGGYSGGSGGFDSNLHPSGNGGGSYNGGTNQSNSIAETGGDGQVVISWPGVSSCPSTSRTPVTVSISTPPTAGSVTGASTIVYGSSTGTMTLSGHTGTVAKWQSSPDGSTWTDIVNTTTTCSDQTPTAPGTWQYRAQVSLNTCTEFSSPFSIVVTKKELTIGGTYTARNKSFDDTAAATIDPTNLTLLTKVGSDVVTLSGTAATFDNKGVGNGKTVTLTGSTLGGANAAKYTLSLTGAPTATANITAIAPTIGTFSAINKTYGDPAFVLVNPTSNSSGSFSYASSDETVATILGNTVTILKAGTSTITATQAASDVLEGFSSGTTSALLTVAKANQVLTLSPLPTGGLRLDQLVGTQMLISASSSAGLPATISVQAGSPATIGLTDGKYYLTTTGTTGTVVVIVDQAGDDNYNAAQISNSFDVTKGNQDITFSTLSPKTYGDPAFTASATGGSSGEPVIFTSSNSLVATCSGTNGSTITITGAGNCTIFANQAGNSSWNPAQTVSQVLTVNKATPDITFSAINKVYTDVPFTLDATSASTGVFTYASSDARVATVAKVSAVTTATITGVGPTTLTATQAADANYISATKDATLTVSKADQTITFGTLADKIVGDASFNLAATSTSGLAVSFASATASVASLSGVNNATVTVGVAGTSTITVSQAGDSHYNAAPNVQQTLTVLACTNPTNGGTIATAQENCTNFDPAAMTSSGLPTGHPAGATLEYQWQKSTTSSSAGFSNITDATATTYDPGTISQTTWYRRMAKVSCQASWTGAAESNVVAMTVSPTVGGVVTGASTAAYDNPVTLTLSGHTGTVLKWQSSPDGSTWTDIENTTTTCIVTPAARGTWQYRAQVQSYSCLTKFSAVKSISVTPNPLTISGISVVTKTYDGNTTATLTGTAALVGVKAGETVTLGGTSVVTFASRNAASGIEVTVTGYTISGTHAGNYTITQPTGLTGNITAKELTPHITANNKLYDGTTTATLSTQLVTGMVTGETDVTLVVGTSNFDTKDIGTGKTVTATTLSLGGTKASNYSLASGATATDLADIAAVQLTPSITANSKPYDGTTTATLSAQSVSGMVNDETDVTLVVGAATFDNKDKGTNKTVTATTLSLGGSKAGNYVLATGATATALTNISAVVLTPNITASSKTYDGNTLATLSAQSVTGMVNSETDVTLVVGAANFDTKNIGTGKTVTATSLSLGGTKAGNYTLVSGATATTTAAITAKTLTPYITANDRPYNGITTATLSAQSVTGMISGETDVTLVVGAANFDNSNIGINKTVTASTLSLGGTAKGNYVLAGEATATDQADITVVQVTPQITANDKPYDGTATATLSAQSVSGVVSGETVTLVVGSASFNNADKGVGKTVTASNLSLGGASAANYVLSSSTATDLADITAVQLTPHITAIGKTYDGNTKATLSAQWVSGMTEENTNVILLVDAANFDTKNIGKNKTVTATGLTLGGADASNFTLSSTTATDLQTIAAVEVTPHIESDDKPYDGLTTATLREKYVTGQILDEEVTLVATANFDTKNTGTGKTVTTSALTLGGADAGNYVLTSSAPMIAQAAITVLQVTPYITASDKQYDGNTSAILSGQSVDGALTGEIVTLTVGAVSFDTKNVGIDKEVTASNLSLSGADAGNYQLTEGVTATDLADITAVQLTPHITAADKAYDGSTTATLSAQSVTGQLSGETVTLIVGASDFASKSVGSNKMVTATDLSLRGDFVGNYILATSTATDLADIMAIQVTPTVVSGNKAYDGSTTATLSSKSLAGQLSGDEVSLEVGSATFDTKLIGADKEVTASGMTLSGADAGNYLLTNTSVTDQADITAAILTPHITANDKAYDGTKTATLSAQSVTGQQSGETVTLEVGATNFDSKNVGTGKTVTASNLTLSGADAGNYALALGATATDLADVTAVDVTLHITADDKTYDGNATATLSEHLLMGRISGDDLSLDIGAVNFDTKSVGINKTVTASALTLRGADAGNYLLAHDATATDLADIRAIQLYVSGAVAETKAYDGNNIAQISGAKLAGKSGTDEVALAANPTGTFAQVEIKNGIVVTPALELTGADAGNFVLVQPEGLKANITVRPLAIGGSFVVNDRPYNGSTAATIATNNLTLLTKVGTEAVTLLAVATFDSKTPGADKVVSLAGSTLAGADAANYILSLNDAPTSIAAITANAPVLSAFPAIGKTYGNPAFVLVGPTSDSPGTFSYTSSDESVATISGKTVTILKAGTSTITATQAAEAGFASGTISALLTVAKANQLLTLTVPTTAPLNTFTGTSLAITATASSALPVTITKSGTATSTLNGSPGSYTLTGISATGTIVITATQAGNDNYNSATASESFDVQKNNQTITFSDSFVPSYVFAPSLSVDLSAASLASSRLSVSYGVVSGPATISGRTLNVTGAGVVVVQASQSGDSNTNSSPPVNQDITISKATPEITFANISKSYGDVPFTLKATSAGTGALTFESSDTSVSTTEKVASLTTATITGAGETTISVTRDADANYNEAMASATLTVSKANQVITMDPLPTPVSVVDFDDTPLRVVVASTSGLPVTLTLSDGSEALLSGIDQLYSTLKKGTVTVNAHQEGDTNFNPAEAVSRTFVVTDCMNPTSGGVIAQSQVICYGSRPSALTSVESAGGYSGIPEYKWQYSTTGAEEGFQDIAASNAAGYSPAALTQATWYRRLVRTSCMSGWTGAVASNVVAIAVDPATIAGTIAGSATVCSGSNSTTLTLSGYSGMILKWQKSTDDWATATDVENTSTTLLASDLTVTTRYRAVVRSGVCQAVNSAAATVGVNPQGQVNQPANQSVYVGTATAVVNFATTNTGGTTTYTWTNSKSSIGLPSSGTGNIASFTAVNTGTAPVVATIAVTPFYSNDGVTCEGGSKIFTITVNPGAQVNQPVNLTVGNAKATAGVSFTTSNTGGTTTYTWVNSNTIIGLPALGSGDIASFTAVNTGSAPVVATITVTPHYSIGGVTSDGPAKSFTITVNPTAQVSQPASQILCSGSASAAVTFATVNTGGATTYAWSNSNTAIGLAASGSGNIASFKATSEGASALTATLTVTPSFVNGGVVTTGAAKTFTITVNPVPAAATVSDRSICQNTSVSLGAAAVTGSTYSWSSAPSGFSSSAANPAVTPLVTTRYTLTETISATGCSASNSVLVTVNPLPAAIPGADRSICPGTSTTLGGTAVAGNSYIWSSVPAGYTSMLANPVITPSLTTKYVVTEVMAITGCTNSQSVLVTVKPSYQLAVSGLATVCSGTRNVVYSTTPGMSSYQWTLPSGASIVSGATTSTISVDYSSSATSGNVRVSGTTECGTVQSANYAVTVNPTPTTPSFVVQNHTLISNTDLGNQWYLNGAAVLTGGNDRQFTAANGGTVALLISLKGCVSPLTSSVTIAPMLPNVLELNTYPNPNYGQFELRIEMSTQAYFTIDIFNDYSQLLYRKQKVFVDKLLVEPIDLAGVPSGTYFVKVYNAEASQVVKVIIRK